MATPSTPTLVPIINKNERTKILPRSGNVLAESSFFHFDHRLFIVISGKYDLLSTPEM